MSDHASVFHELEGLEIPDSESDEEEHVVRPAVPRKPDPPLSKQKQLSSEPVAAYPMGMGGAAATSLGSSSSAYNPAIATEKKSRRAMADYTDEELTKKSPPPALSAETSKQSAVPRQSMA